MNASKFPRSAVYLSGLILWALAQTSYAISLKCSMNSKEQFKVEIENIRVNENFKVTLSLRNPAKNVQLQTDRKDQVSFVAPKGLFADGESLHAIEVRVIDYYSQGNDFSARCYHQKVAAKEQQLSQYISNQRKLPAAAKKLSGFAQEMILSEAQQQAKLVAERLLASYGQRANHLHHFLQGFKFGYASSVYVNVVNESFQKGYDQGMASIRANASEAVEKAAYHLAQTHAQMDAENRHRQAVSHAGVVDYEVRIAKEAFNPREFTDAVWSYDQMLEQAFAKLDAQLEGEFKNLTFGPDELKLRFSLADGFGVKDLLKMDGVYQLSLAEFSEQRALDDWQQNELGGGFDFSTFDKLAQKERLIFAAEFKKVYRDVLQERLKDQVLDETPAAYARGAFWGAKVGDKESELKGYRIGHADGAKKFAQAGFTETYKKDYPVHFQRWVNHYDINPHLDAQLELKANPNRPGFYNLSGVITNLSGVSIEGVDVVTASPVLDQVDRVHIASLPAYSETKINYESFLSIKRPILPDQSYPIEVAVGEKKIMASINVTQDDLLKLFLHTRDEEVRFHLYGSILASVQAEWDKNRLFGKKNIYQQSFAKLESSFLGKLIKQHKDDNPLEELRIPLQKLERKGDWLYFHRNIAYKKLLDKLDQP